MSSDQFSVTASGPWRMWGMGPSLSDQQGWDGAPYYKTIQLADIDGDGKAELLARSIFGVQAWRWTGAWTEMPHTLGLSDASGYNHECYYATIQCADIDGDGKAELLARGGHGLSAWRYSPAQGWVGLAALGDLGDGQGFNLPQFYKTIQCADIDGDGRAEILSLTPGGVAAWKYGGDGKFSRLGDVITEAGPLSGWAAGIYYPTLQCADIDGDGCAELIGRGGAGVHVWKLDVAHGKWRRTIPTLDLSDGEGWNHPQFAFTIQCADIDGDGKAELVARGSAGLRAYSCDGATWNRLPDGPGISDEQGWDGVGYYSTMRCADLNGDGRAEVVARSGQGLRVWMFTGDAWAELNHDSNFADAAGWDAPRHYETLVYGDINGDGRAELLARGSAGIQTWSLTNRLLSPHEAVVTHDGATIAFARDPEGNLGYQVLTDNGALSAPLALEFPAEVRRVGAQGMPPFATETLPAPAGWYNAPFTTVSDGQYVYLLFTKPEYRSLYVARFVFSPKTGRLVRNQEARYIGTGRKYVRREYRPENPQADRREDKLQLEDDSGAPIFEPIIELPLPPDSYRPVPVAATLIPTLRKDEYRWQIFAAAASRVRAISVAYSQRDLFDVFVGADARVDTADTELSDGQIARLFTLSEGLLPDSGPQLPSLAGYLLADRLTAALPPLGDGAGLASLVYARKVRPSKADSGEIAKIGAVPLNLKGPTRLMLAMATAAGAPVQVAIFACSDNGLLQPVDRGTSGEDAVTAPGVLADGQTRPVLLDSADSYIYLYARRDATPPLRYNSLDSTWSGSYPGAAAAAPPIWSHQPLVAEYGALSYELDERQRAILKATMRRAFFNSRRAHAAGLWRKGDAPLSFNRPLTLKACQLECKLIRTSTPQPQLVGYIEGAPPVPRENLTGANDYTSASSLTLTRIDQATRLVSASHDTGFDMEIEAKVGGEFGDDLFSPISGSFGAQARFNLTTSWLNEAQLESTKTHEIDQTHNLIGVPVNGVWTPRNRGQALLLGLQVHLFLLYRPDTLDPVCYRLVPGRLEYSLVEFDINPAYTRNGDLDSYLYTRKGDLQQLEDEISRREAERAARFAAFNAAGIATRSDVSGGWKLAGSNSTKKLQQNLPALAVADLVNETIWSRSGHVKQEARTLSVTQESTGGSSAFTGLAGVYGSFKYFSFAAEMSALFGGHLNLTAKKSESSSQEFSLSIDLDGLPKPATLRKDQVNMYAFKTFYLSPSADSFDTFFEQVVDPAWLQDQSDPGAAALRGAQARPNQCWRVLYRVTAVSRRFTDETFTGSTALLGAGIDSAASLVARVGEELLVAQPAAILGGAGDADLPVAVAQPAAPRLSGLSDQTLRAAVERVVGGGAPEELDGIVAYLRSCGDLALTAE